MWTNLHFLRPWWFIAILPLIWILWQIKRHKLQDNPWRKLVDPHLLPYLLTNNNTVSSQRTIMLLLGLGGMIWILALAGPTWQRLPQPVYQTQKHLIIALDLSTSMNATDIAPSRLAQAKFKILDILRKTQEGQIALITYGTEPFIVSPLTTDAATLTVQIPLLKTSLLPVQGERRTDLAIAYAAKLLKQVNSHNGQILLITDSVAPLDATLKAAQQLYKHGHSLSILAVGTVQGAPIPLSNGGFVKDLHGAIILSRLKPQHLKKVAKIGGGQYVTSRIDNQDLETLLSTKTQLSSMHSIKSMKYQTTQADTWREEGPWLLLILLPIVALWFRRSGSPMLLCLLLIPSPKAHAFSWQDLWWSSDQQAAYQLANGKPQEAARRFQRSDWKAAAQYQAKDYVASLETLNQIQDVNADTYYNRGNALAKLGRFKEALAAYKQALALKPEDEDVKYNYNLIKQLLKQQQQASQQSQSANDSKRKQDSKSSDNVKRQQESQNPKISKQQQESQNNTKSQDSNKVQDSTKSQSPKSDRNQKSIPKKQPNQDQSQTQSNKQQQMQDNKPGQTIDQKHQQSRQYPSRPKANIAKQKTSSGMSNNTKNPKQRVQQEQQQAIKYQLNQIPDDPGGILRQLFKEQYRKRRYQQY